MPRFRNRWTDDPSFECEDCHTVIMDVRQMLVHQCQASMMREERERKMYEEKPKLKGLFRDNDATKEGKYLVLRRDNTVPTWPWFVLGARDPMAAWALWFYSWIGVFYTWNWDYLKGVNRLSWDYYDYRHKHGDGDPDAGPHREDNPFVIARMKEGRGA